MELQALAVPPALAREKFQEYRQAVRERHNAEDEMLMRGYREIVRGRQVIDMASIIRAGGSSLQRSRQGVEYDAPRLAVMRADALWCWVERTRTGAVRFYGRRDNKHVWAPRSTETRYVISLPVGTLDEVTTGICQFNVRAMVPPIPPSLRPADKLSNYHILWEAEWQAVAPKDPALLKHIGGDLYVVLAMWELTELERSVLSRRF